VESFRRGDYAFPVYDGGPVDGVPVVLLHGFPQSKESWQPLAIRLQASGCRTIAPDQRGYSPEARPKRRRDYRLDALAGDVEALLTTIGDRPVHLVGHDWGAAVAWATAARYPGRVASLTALSVPHPAALLTAMASSRQALRSWYMFLFQLPGFPEWLYDPGRPRSRARLLRWLRSYGQTRERSERDLALLGDEGFSAALGWYRAMLLASPLQLRRPVRVPTLYVWAAGDKAITRSAALRCRRFVQGPYRFVELPDASHWFPEEVPDQLAELILAHASEFAAS
jgi:pimeloyl-ACP methyl ester carboxylesterase